MCTLVSVHRPPDSRAERPTCEKTSVRSIRFTMSSPSIISAGGRVPRGTGVMCTSQGLLSKAHDEPLYVLNHAYDGLRCGAPRGTVRVPDDSLFGKTFAKPAHTHVEYVPPAHFYVKETSHLCRGRSWWRHALQTCVSDCGDPRYDPGPCTPLTIVYRTRR